MRTFVDGEMVGLLRPFGMLLRHSTIVSLHHVKLSLLLLLRRRRRRGGISEATESQRRRRGSTSYGPLRPQLLLLVLFLPRGDRKRHLLRPTTPTTAPTPAPTLASL